MACDSAAREVSRACHCPAVITGGTHLPMASSDYCFLKEALDTESIPPSSAALGSEGPQSQASGALLCGAFSGVRDPNSCTACPEKKKKGFAH